MSITVVLQMSIDLHHIQLDLGSVSVVAPTPYPFQHPTLHGLDHRNVFVTSIGEGRDT